MIPNRTAVVEMTIGLVVMAGTVQAASTFINTCPTVISSPGDYLLAADLICGGPIPGITIASSDVTLRLEGHRITAGQGASTAIVVLGSSLRLQGVHILGPGLITNGGKNAFSDGVAFAAVNNSEVSGVTVLGSGGNGIEADNCDFLTITANTVGRNGSGFSLGGGIVLSGVYFSTIAGNDASGNNGSGLVAFSGAVFSPLGTVSQNIFNGNTSDGLVVAEEDSVFTGATIQQNVTNGNGGDGISIVNDGPSEVTNNTSLANGTNDLADLTQGCLAHVWSGNTFFTANQSCIH